jgi:hypothetical protein
LSNDGIIVGKLKLNGEKGDVIYNTYDFSGKESLNV